MSYCFKKWMQIIAVFWISKDTKWQLNVFKLFIFEHYMGALPCAQIGKNQTEYVCLTEVYWKFLFRLISSLWTVFRTRRNEMKLRITIFASGGGAQEFSCKKSLLHANDQEYFVKFPAVYAQFQPKLE